VIDELKARLMEHSAGGLADAVSHAVRDGVLEPGATLPTVRAVAAALKLSTTTVNSAWGLLSRAGVIRTDGRRGTVITHRSASGRNRYRRALQYPVRFHFDLSTGLPDPTLLPDLAPALRRLHATDPLRTYLDDPVLPELHEQLHAGWPFEPEALTICDGVGDALDLIINTLLRYGERVAVEHPTDPTLLDLLEAAGIRPIAVDMDGDGAVPESLAAVLAAGARIAFVQPRAHQPTGISINSDRATELAEAVRAHDGQVIEIDYFGTAASVPVHSLGRVIPERTIHIRGFAASHGPELRIAAVGGSHDPIEDLVHRRHLGQGWTSRVLQALLVDLLTNAQALRQVNTARQEYAHRRRKLVAELHEHDIDVLGDDGRFIWMPVASEASALVSLTSQGIGVAPGTPFSVRAKFAPHICITAGLLPVVHAAEIAEALAAAARPPSPQVRSKKAAARRR
jgi:DNA-binding transcriptional MocR family regulator